MKILVISWVVILFLCHCGIVWFLCSVTNVIFYVNSSQFERDFIIFAKEQEILCLQKWISETSIPEYKVYLQGKIISFRSEK